MDSIQPPYQSGELDCTAENAIYICPHVSMNYGYYLPASKQPLSGNTYNFICEKKRNIEIFVAPLALRHYFTKEFVPYGEYKAKVEEYIHHLQNTQSMCNVIIEPNATHTNTLKKTNSYSDLGIFNDWSYRLKIHTDQHDASCMESNAPGYHDTQLVIKMMEIFGSNIDQ